MGRPLKFERNQALNLAIEEFWTNGYKKTSVYDLVQKIGITRSSFYNSFGSREALFQEALVIYAGRAPDALLNDIQANDPVLPAIRAMFREIARARASDGKARGCMAVNALGELVGSDEMLGPFMEEMLKRKIELFKKLFSQAVQQKELPKNTNVEALALEVSTFLCGLNLISKAIHNEKELWNIARTFLDRLGFPPIMARRKSTSIK